MVGLAAAQLAAERAAAADVQEKPAARWRMSEYSSRSCAEDCIAQCRAAKAQCSTAKERADECRAQFQICARRCVVACSAR